MSRRSRKLSDSDMKDSKIGISSREKLWSGGESVRWRGSLSGFIASCRVPTMPNSYIAYAAVLLTGNE